MQKVILLTAILIFFLNGCLQSEKDFSYKREQVENYSWKLLNAANIGYTNVLIIDPHNPEVVYAGIDVGGVYKSYDYGNHWMPSNNGLIWPADRIVAAFTIDPNNGNIYLGVGAFGKGGMFKSTDNGASWQLLTRKIVFNVKGIEQAGGKGLIVIDPFDSSTIYSASYEDGLFKSVDEGKTWLNIGLKGVNVSSILISPSDPKLIYAASVKKGRQSENPESGIYRSTDGGYQWKRLDSRINDVYQMAMDPTNPDIIYAACGELGIMKTRDGGNTWKEINKGLEGIKTVRYISLAVDPINSKAIYAGSGDSGGHIYRSENGGDSWTNLTKNREKIYPDGWWIREVNWPGGKNYSAQCLTIDPEGSARIYATGRSGIWRSDDNGITWHAKVYGLEGAGMLGIAINQADADMFFVGEYDYLMFRTVDGGKTFDRPLKGIGNWDIIDNRDVWQKYRAKSGLAFAIDPRNTPATIYIGTAGSSENTGTIFKSSDGGDSWREANNGLPVGRVTALAIDQTNYNKLFAIFQDHGLYRTTDGGSTWSMVDIGIKNKRLFTWKSINLIFIHPKFPQIIYILDKSNGIYKTTDGGTNWTDIGRNLPEGGIGGMDQYVGGLAVDYDDPDIVYAGLRHHGVYKSTDGGKMWGKITPPYILHGGAMSIDPNDNSLYLASVPASGDEDIKGFSPGIYKSNDRGKTWFPIHNDEILNISLKVTFMSASRGKVYISTQGNGLIVGEANR